MSAKIIFLGPESTGKSTISAEIAKLCNAVFVNEYARTYLNEHGTDYSYTDVVKIAETQAQLEREAEATKKIVICDTDLITIKIWMEYYNWNVPEWIESFIVKHLANKYLLLYPDIPWMADEQRKNPTDRIELFNRFEQHLIRLNVSYSIIKGIGQTRFENCLKEVHKTTLL
ncbi:MAG: ATP-binding protein [Chitinophagales bacterium]|nr:ATP-binding protein [Chitinophagales bacterium]